jgi:hypothetical protein
MGFWNKGEGALRMKTIRAYNKKKSVTKYPIEWECYKPSTGEVKSDGRCDTMPKPTVTPEEEQRIKTEYYTAFPHEAPGYAENMAARTAAEAVKSQESIAKIKEYMAELNPLTLRRQEIVNEFNKQLKDVDEQIKLIKQKYPDISAGQEWSMQGGRSRNTSRKVRKSSKARKSRKV